MKFKVIATLLVLVVLLLSTLVVLLLVRRSNESLDSVISGNFNINGVVPNGATISLTQKEAGTGESQTFASGLPVVDSSPWSFTHAKSGKNYEIQARVIVGGKAISSSNILSVTSPADNEELTINLEAQKQTGNAVISGNIVVNGYIPSGATISVQGRKLGSQKFTTVAANLTANTTQFLSYTTAVPGTTYEVQGVLKSQNGTIIGTSNALAVTAPALNETLTINSSAAPAPTASPSLPTQAPSNPTPTQAQNPPGAATVSGSINLNGSTPPNARIVIFQTGLNGNNYQQAVNNVSPTDGATWSWSSAQNATWYTLIAVLKQHNSNGTDTDIATSAPVTVAAPASNVMFTLNSGYSLSAPGGPISVTCQTYNGGPNQNTWNVVVNFATVPGAQSYWFQIGNNNGGNNIVNTATQTNNSSQQTTNTTFNNNTTYYARYAYANVPVATLGSSQYSSFSSSTPLQCSH